MPQLVGCFAPRSLQGCFSPLTTLVSHDPSNTVWFSAPAWHWGFPEQGTGAEAGWNRQLEAGWNR
jgi:hypothetical protein